MRQRTTFEICANHQGWFAGTTRYRKAEVFCEGGPAHASPCDHYHPCRLFAGTDLFCQDVCTGEYPLDWAVNRSA